MTQISTKRKKALIISVIIVVLVISSIVAAVINLSLSTNQKDNVTVSGTLYSGAYTVFPASLQRIEFTDIQTGTKTTFDFHFAPQRINGVGNYSVTLKNEHTYNVTISYYSGPSPGNMYPGLDSIGIFTVHAPAGKTSISIDWG